MGVKSVEKIEGIIIPNILLKLEKEGYDHSYDETECSIIIRSPLASTADIKRIVNEVYSEFTNAKKPENKFDVKTLNGKIYIYFYSN